MIADASSLPDTTVTSKPLDSGRITTGYVHRVRKLQKTTRISIAFPNRRELDNFERAIAEERRLNPGINLNKSNVAVRLIEKWVACEITI